MAVEAPFPELDEFLLAIGEAGKSIGGVSWRTNATGPVAHRTPSSMRRR